MNDIHKRHFDVDFDVPEDGYVDFIVKPEGSLSSTRYFYGNVVIEYILPSDL
jgi:hypothetical protein